MLFNRDFTKKEIYLFVAISLAIVLPINVLLEDFVSLWSLTIIPVIGLLHIYPKWKTGIFSILALSLIEITSEIYLHNVINKESLIQDLVANLITNFNLILILTFFRIKNANIQVVDPLTKALNRKYYNLFVNDKKNLNNLSIQLIDIDHFKKVNDTYGHTCGDYVLAELVKVINKEIRKTDKVVRLGGEEFAILSPNTSSEEGCKIAHRVRHLVEKTDFIYEGQTIPVTISIGLANQKEKEPIDIKLLFNKADKALYMAKQNGRNQVACLA